MLKGIKKKSAARGCAADGVFARYCTYIKIVVTLPCSYMVFTSTIQSHFLINIFRVAEKSPAFIV